MTVYQHLPLTRRQVEEPDTSLAASVADLLDALQQAQRERDQALAEAERQARRVEIMQHHLQRTQRTLARVAGGDHG